MSAQAGPHPVADPHAFDHAHDQSHGHDHDHGHESSHHGSFRDYLIGFGLSVVLTAIPFWIVMDNVFRDPKVAAIVLLLFAVVQIVVHMVYFLHMNTKSEGGWTVLALIFTAILVVIALTGSLWIMHHLDTNMMPDMTPHQARHMP
jgi:cytochrome o ubiquinol oxidase operon protein cyoD